MPILDSWRVQQQELLHTLPDLLLELAKALTRKQVQNVLPQEALSSNSTRLTSISLILERLRLPRLSLLLIQHRVLTLVVGLKLCCNSSRRLLIPRRFLPLLQ